MATYTDQELLDAWRQAEYEIATRGVKSYRIGDRMLTAFDLPEIAQRIDYYTRRVANASTQRPAVGTFRRPSGGAERLQGTF